MRRSLVILMGIIAGLMLVVGACAKATPTPAPSTVPTPKPSPTSSPTPTATPTPTPTSTSTATPKPSPTSSPTPTAGGATDFYKSNTVTLVVSSSPGGGTDYVARSFATFWQRLTGGVMVVRNEPGGAGLASPNLVYTAKPDGLTLGLAHTGSHMILPTLYKDPGLRADVTKFRFIGRTGADPFYFTVAKSSPANSIADLQKMKGLKFISSVATDATTLTSVLVCDFFNLDAKVVPGFHSSDVPLILGRAEAAGAGKNASAVKDWVDKGYAKKPLVFMGLKRDQWYPDTPAMGELVQLTPEQKGLLVQITLEPGGKLFFTPPGLDDTKLQFLRDTFDKIMVDKGFVDAQLMRMAVWTGIDAGKDIDASMKEGLSISAADLARGNAVLTKWVQR